MHANLNVKNVITIKHKVLTMGFFFSFTKSTHTMYMHVICLINENLRKIMNLHEFRTLSLKKNNTFSQHFYHVAI